MCTCCEASEIVRVVKWKVGSGSGLGELVNDLVIGANFKESCKNDSTLLVYYYAVGCAL